MKAIPTFEYSPTSHIPEQSREAARRRLAAKRRALEQARQNHPNESVTPAMMTAHYDTALQFLSQLDTGRFGATIEDRAGALAVVLAGAVAGAKAAGAPLEPPCERAAHTTVRAVVADLRRTVEIMRQNADDMRRQNHGGETEVYALADSYEKTAEHLESRIDDIAGAVSVDMSGTEPKP